jgi:hypothetical protein
MSKKISLEDVEARLRGSQTAISKAEAAEQQNERAQSADFIYEEEESGGMSAGFMASCVAVFLGVGAATYFFTGSNISLGDMMAMGSHKSVVDDVCSVGWRDDRSNKDQIHCYLTKKVSRLCDATERAHLTRKLKDFEIAHARTKMEFMGETLSSIPNPVVVGLETAKLGKGNDMETAQRLTDMMSSSMSGIQANLDRNRNKVSVSDVQSEIRKLYVTGYLSDRDFGLVTPSWIQKAIKDATPSGATPCKS